MFKVPKQGYTTEFKVAAVQQVNESHGFAVVTRELGIPEQTFRNGLKADASGKLGGSRSEASHAGAEGTVASASGEQWPASGA